MRLIRTLLARLSLVALLLGAAGGAVGAETPPDLALRFFEEAALWHDGRTLGPPRKWRQAPRVQVVGNPGEGLERLAVDAVDEAARLAGFAPRRAGPSAEATLVVRFEDSAGYVIGGRAAACYATTRWTPQGEIVHAELVVNVSLRPMLKQCLVHETMHAFGFPGHPHGFDSVLSYLLRRDGLTPLDRLAYRVLYDPALRANGEHMETLAVARRLIAAQRGARDDATLGSAAQRRAVASLREAAEAGQPYAQRQFGLALAAGHAGPADPAAARAWWRKAAELGDVPSRTLLDAAGEHSAAGRNARD